MPEIIVKLGDRLIHRYYFDKDVLSIGRARDNDIVIENLSVSRNHARIKRQDGKYILVDMNSSNGSMVNGVRITKTEVVHDDQITIGKHTLHFINKDQPDQVVELSAESSSHLGKESFSSEAIPQQYHAQGIIGVLEVSKGKQQGQQFKVYKAESTLGRAPVNDVRIHDWLVSNRHAAIHRRGNDYFLEDLGSWRGTEVNGKPVKKEVPIKEGDTIVVGTTMLTFGKADAASIKPPAPIQIPEHEDSVEEPPALPHTALGQPEEPVQDAPSDFDLDLDSVHLDSSPLLHEVEPESIPLSVPTGDDEFAPFTDEELEALEAEADIEELDEEEERHRREMWEMTEGEKRYELGGGDSREQFSLVESHEELTDDEQHAVGEYNPHITPRPSAALDDLEAVEEELEEEEALYGGPMGDHAPYGSMEREPAMPPPTPQADPSKNAEVRMWEKALRNKSAIIRKNASRELKRLTGKDYDWQSEPTGN